MKNTIAQIQALAISKESNVRPIVLAGLSILAVLVSMYVYFVGKIVFDVIARRTAESTIHLTQSSVSQLQVAYFNATRNLDIADAGSVGLMESHDTLYASRVSSPTVGMVVH